MTTNKKAGAPAATSTPETKKTAIVDSTTNTRKKSRGTGRTRNFACVLYPESMAHDLIEKLTQTHIPAFLSPLHDRDKNPDGTPKKPHYHLIIMFETVKTKEQAKAVFESLGGVGLEVVSTLRGYARYLIHADNPEKAQYSAVDVRAFSGADYESAIHLPSDDVTAVKEMMAFIRKNEIRSFAKLCDICAEHYPDWFNILFTRSTVFIKEYIKSSTWEDYGGSAICHTDSMQEKTQEVCDDSNAD